jgi:hypothetical protein
MDEERLLTYHRFTREHGVVRSIGARASSLVLFFLLYFRLARSDASTAGSPGR